VAYTITPQPEGCGRSVHSSGRLYTPSLGAWQSCCTVVAYTIHPQPLL